MKVFPDLLTPGSKGPAVLILQLCLQSSKFGDEVIADGDYGPKTAEAVKALQEDYDIKADGNFGPETRAVMKENHGPDLDALMQENLSGQTTVPETSGSAAAAESVETSPAG